MKVAKVTSSVPAVTSNVRKLINPSPLLIAAGHVLASGYVPTCNIVGCSCTDHDRGYRFAEILFPVDWTDKEIYVSQKTKGRHHRSFLRSEHVAAKQAIGLPDVAPDWAYTPETRRLEGDFCFGSGVDVSTELGFKVVTLFVGYNDDKSKVGFWKEKDIYATGCGFEDDTIRFLAKRKEVHKTDFLARRMNEGFLEDEAKRMYDIPKELQLPWQLPILIGIAEKMRASSVETIYQLIVAESRLKQALVLNHIGIIESVGSLTHPQVCDIAEKALWIFHGTNLHDAKAKAPVTKKTIIEPKKLNGPPRSKHREEKAPVDDSSIEPAKPKDVPRVLTPERLAVKPPRLDPSPSPVVKPGDWSPSSGTLASSASTVSSGGSMFALGGLFTSAIGNKFQAR